MPNILGTKFPGTLTTVALLASLALAQTPKNTPKQDGGQTVYTMRAEYEIKPRGDGKTWLLRRLNKDGSIRELIPLTRVSEKDGEPVYVDSGGTTYTTLSDGTLQERIKFSTAPTIQPPSAGQVPGPAPQLMTATPIVPHSRSPRKLSNFTPATGDNQFRTDGELIFLTTGFDDKGRRNEVAVQKVADRWYVRTSASNNPGEAPAFRLEDDGTVSGYAELPPGVPEIATLNGVHAVPLPVAPASVAPAAVAVPPAVDYKAGEIPVEYEGRKGTLLTRAGEQGQRFYVNLEGEPRAVELESVRGSNSLFTPIGRDDIFVVMDRQGKLTVTDSSGQAASLIADVSHGQATPTPAPVDAVPTPPRPVEPPTQPASVATPRQPMPVAAYSGPMSGTLECNGNPIPQNGEQVFANLPPLKLQLTYDRNTWEASLVPNGQQQRLILRNKKPGSQKKCSIHWTVVQ